MPSELVRQHPKRNTLHTTHPPTQQKSIQHMLLLSFALARPSQEASRDGKCASQLCVCVCVCVLVCGTSAESSEAQLGRRNTCNLSPTVCACACVYTCEILLCVRVLVYMRGATFLEPARVLKVTRRHSGKRSSLYCLDRNIP